jgi:site-specific DNA-methyltransferase (adenine-specific)
VKNQNVHFSSARDDWSTPQELFDALTAEFGPFTLDPASTHENTKCARHFTIQEDGLSQDWGGAGERIWLNPPYGREIGRWLKLAVGAAMKGALVVALLPARPDTVWWWRYVLRGQIRYLKGRLKFGGSKTSAPFPSAVVIFRPRGKKSRRRRVFADGRQLPLPL